MNVVFDSLSGYQKKLIRKLTGIGLSEGPNIERKCSKWVTKL